MGVSAPADRRFKRARVGPPRPARWWQPRARMVARLVTLAVAALAATVGLRHLTTQSDALRVQDIRVAGLQRLTAADIEVLIADVRGATMVSLDLDRVREALRASPWIADATVRRVVPRTLELTVVERMPIGVARFPSGLFLIDETGALVDRFGPKYADLDLPIVDGFEIVPRPGLRVEPARAQLATRVLRALGARPELLRRLSQVDVSDDRNAVAMLEGDPALLHLGHERFAERLQTYLDMAPALHQRVQAIDYIDLRFEERVYLRPVLTKADAGAAGRSTRPALPPDPEPESDQSPDAGLIDEPAPPREPAQ